MSTLNQQHDDLERPPLRSAIGVSIGLSLLFMVVYSGTNWFSSTRDDVGTLYFSWEEIIPFVPLMVIPYMSIDLFFVLAPLLCQSRLELKLFSRRIMMAILVAGVCFLLFPLELARDRPVAQGWTGAIYNWFITVDQPYNLCPSLHIALRTVLAAIYAVHSRGVLRFVLYIWFSLIGLSTLLTYQHHVIDIVGGFILATYCFYFVQPVSLRLPRTPNYRVGSLYALATVLLIALSVLFWPWGVFFLWPAVATVLITAGYFYLGPGVFRKSAGRLPLSSQIVLFPVLLGQQLSLLYYRRQCRAWDQVTPNVWIGRHLNDQEAQQAVAQGVTSVADLTVAFAEAKPFLEANYFHLPVLDLTAPTQAQLQEAVRILDQQSAQGVVYVHCKIGYSRSAAVAAAWLLHTGAAQSVEDAITQLRAVRESIVIRPEIRGALEEFTRSLAH